MSKLGEDRFFNINVEANARYCTAAPVGLDALKVVNWIADARIGKCGGRLCAGGEGLYVVNELGFNLLTAV